jgi:hypothetical protein
MQNRNVPLAALIMRLLVSKEGLKGSVGWQRSWKFYLFAFLAPILFFSLLALFNHLIGLVYRLQKPKAV